MASAWAEMTTNSLRAPGHGPRARRPGWVPDRASTCGAAAEARHADGRAPPGPGCGPARRAARSIRAAASRGRRPLVALRPPGRPAVQRSRESDRGSIAAAIRRAKVAASRLERMTTARACVAICPPVRPGRAGAAGCSPPPPATIRPPEAGVGGIVAGQRPGEDQHVSPAISAVGPCRRRTARIAEWEIGLARTPADRARPEKRGRVGDPAGDSPALLVGSALTRRGADRAGGTPDHIGGRALEPRARGVASHHRIVGQRSRRGDADSAAVMVDGSGGATPGPGERRDEAARRGGEACRSTAGRLRRRSSGSPVLCGWPRVGPVRGRERRRSPSARSPTAALRRFGGAASPCSAAAGALTRAPGGSRRQGPLRPRPPSG